MRTIVTNLKRQEEDNSPQVASNHKKESIDRTKGIKGNENKERNENLEAIQKALLKTFADPVID